MKPPKTIPVFPLSNFIIFPKTTVPLNIFEPRYIDMVNDSMKADKFIGMVQPKITKNFDDNKLPSLHKVGCLGKISSFKESDDGRYLIELKGVIRFEIKKEIDTSKKYREFEIDCDNYLHDLDDKKEDLKFSDLEIIFKDFKTFFEKRGFIINWKSPFSLEEKQALLETKNLSTRKTKIAEILNTYTYDDFENTTLQ